MAAQAPSSSSSLSEALTSGFLTCTICLECLSRPRILPCLHSYCHDCLEKLAEGRKELHCPECREQVALPCGVGGLKTSFFINGLLDLVRPAGKAEPTCSLCPLIGQEANRPAVSRCLDCADDMCQVCAGGHRCSRLTHSHHVVGMGGYLSGEYDEEIRKRQALQCKEHVGEELRFFCTPCAAVLCRECRLGPHLQHPCLSLAQAAERHRPIIVDLLAGVEETVRLIGKGRAGLEEEMERLKVRETGIRGVVEQACSRAVERLLAHQEEVLSQLSDYVEERKKACETLCSELEFQEQVASSTVAFAQKVLALGREVEIVFLEQMISERLRQLQSFSWEPLSPQLPQLEIDVALQSSSGRRLFRLEFKEEMPTRTPEGHKEGATEGKKKKKKPSREGAQETLLSCQGKPPSGEGSLPTVVPTLPPPKGPEAPLLTPKPFFSCSFWVKTPTDKKRPQVTGLCPFGSSELLVADEMNQKLKRFSLQGEFKGIIPVPSGVAPCSVATVGSKVAFTAGSCLYLLNGEGGLMWKKALQRGQASHAVAALGGDRVAVCVAGRLEVYDLEGRLVETIVPEGTAERCLVFLASRKGGFVGSDWYRHSLVFLSQRGQLVAESREEQLSECQPGAVCADATGIAYVVLREINKVVAFSQDGEELGPFLTAENSINQPRVVTAAGDGRFAVALSNGTVHIFKIRYQGK
ncbi:E3 ubiquitin-protein ligase TRIM56 [Rhineura floridana]|uniref:E3 ubiquitin-protein ligase TRIM56 n=1 Tax=Rhineura floridana TaxID=261503 RepID=UPI002AC85F7F|nr:E3 ubiquitin-protein ligase TRIM56 [Rhineura floridana]XP_061445967.1 E3 ubiquitin-protein ligase TRIM56 [Rhineura floridana]